MTPKLLEFARKSGFTLCKEESALREMLEQFAKFIIEHEAAKQHDNDSVGSASAWFALVMNAAAELEDASHCLRDEDAKRVAISGAKHYRDAANALYTTPPAAPVQEPVAFKIYKPTPSRGAIPNVRDAELPWVYDQDLASGNVASMWVTPVKATPPAAQRQWVGLTDEEVWSACDGVDGSVPNYARAIEAKLKEKNT